MMSGWRLREPGAPAPRLTMLLGVMLVGVTVLVLRNWWQRRALGEAARAQAMPGCIARLGDEATCRDHLAANDEDCARLTFRGGGMRGSPGPARIEPVAYLDCIVLGVDGWVAQNKRKHDEADLQRAREAVQPGH